MLFKGARLRDAAFCGDVDRLEKMLAKGADVNAKNMVGETALLAASEQDKMNVVKILLEKYNADPNIQDINGITPLHAACKSGNLEMTQLLLKHQANMEVQLSGSKKLPLHNACKYGHLDIVTYMLDRCENAPTILEAKDDFTHETPLLKAVKAGQAGVVRELLQRGANIDVQTQHEKYGPLHQAVLNNHFATLQILLQHYKFEAKKEEANEMNGYNNSSTDAFLDAKDDWNAQTALHHASEKGQADFVKTLRDYGASVKAKSDDGKTPIDMAANDSIRLILTSDPEEPQRNVGSVPGKSMFYETLFAGSQEDMAQKSPQELLEALATMTGDVHEMKMFYTMVLQCQRTSTIDQQYAKRMLHRGLATTAETCNTEDAIVVFKLILNKARKDGWITEADWLRFDNRAEVQRMSEATFIKDMKEAIASNTRRIEGLEHRVDEMQNVIKRIVSHIKFRQKMQFVVGMMGAVVGAFTMLVGDGLCDAFDQLTSNIVDFGDVLHVKDEIGNLLEHAGDGSPFESLRDQFLKGIEMISENMVENNEEETLSAMMALGQAAGAASMAEKATEASAVTADSVGEPEITVEPEAEIVVEAECVVKVDGIYKPTAPVEGAIFPDAVLSEEDESKFMLHCAVKYGDEEDVQKEISLMEKNGSGKLNAKDSQGRTALDLAALTGQLELMTLIANSGGTFAFGPRPKMKALAKKRASQSSEYLEQVQASLG